MLKGYVYKYSILKTCVSKTMGFVLKIFCFMCVCVYISTEITVLFSDMLTCIYIYIYMYTYMYMCVCITFMCCDSGMPMRPFYNRNYQISLQK